MAEAAGIPVEFFIAMRQAVGIARPDPDERVCDAQDVSSAQAFAHLRGAGFPEDSLLDVTRVLGAGLAQTADAMRMAMADRAAGNRPRTSTRSPTRNAEAARELLPLMTPLMEHTLRLHMRDQTRSQLFWQAEGASPNLRQVWVAFADMVGFTRLGERIDPHDLGGLVTRLTDLALETVAAPVRLVKTIGDAAMLVSPVPEPLVETALTLVERAEEQGDEFPPLRAGLAGGVALSRGGRLVRPAREPRQPRDRRRQAGQRARHPGGARAAGDDRYSWSRAGRWELKGFRERVPLYRVRRAEEAE